MIRVEAQPDPSDSRGTLLNLSHLGRIRIRQTTAHKGDIFRQRIDNWNDEYLEQLIQLLRRFNGLSACRNKKGGEGSLTPLS